MKILVTGGAGFVGFHLINRLIERGDEVVGYDSINDYYDVRLKYGRLAETGIAQSEIVKGSLVQSSLHPNYRFVQEELENKPFLDQLFEQEKFDVVVNLAAQAGVRYSITNPFAYMSSNMQGFLNVLEACRNFPVKHFVYASSSSVYGLNETTPFSTQSNVDHPVSLYAASKKSNELMAHTYSHLYRIPTTGLRFFTVYGTWGRPDMAYFLFADAILKNEPIKVFNQGDMKRDFTYIDDIVEGVIRVIDKPAVPNPEWNGKKPDPSSSKAPYRIYNIGNSSPVSLMDFIKAIEEGLGRKAEMDMLPMQPGDVPITWANVDDLINDMGYQPNTDIRTGVNKFIEWYKDFYKV